ncbi:MAG: hypothetical protein KIT82_22050 [Bradyrhizobium sp.]|nr:hypothetical protein [Bradyrhizobium sp.]
MSQPSLEVVTPAAAGDARRLTTPEKVKSALRMTDTANDALITSIIDGVSADCARETRLARAGATDPTFGRETLRATWRFSGGASSYKLLVLPWRTPVVSVESVSVAGEVLDQNDFQVIAGGMIQRLSHGFTIGWWRAATVVEFVAGWDLPTGVPAGLEMRVIDQVKMQYLQTTRDPSIRSENVPDVYEASYGVIGGDSIGTSGLLKSLEEALAPYTGWSV